MVEIKDIPDGIINEIESILAGITSLISYIIWVEIKNIPGGINFVFFYLFFLIFNTFSCAYTYILLTHQHLHKILASLSMAHITEQAVGNTGRVIYVPTLVLFFLS